MKSFKTWHLPWEGRNVPHALLDIIRGCNITCEACYNNRPPAVKPLPQIESELDALQRQRRLSSVSLVGGEVLLHPQLDDIVRMIKRRRIDVEIFTNGVLLTDDRLAELKRVGLDVVFIHIESGQGRPDLPEHTTLAQLRELWQAKSAMVARHGIDAALALTAHANRLSEMDAIIRFIVESAHVHYLLITLYRDLTDVACIRGDLVRGMTAEWHPDALPRRADAMTNVQILDRLKRTMGLRPFAYLGSNVDHSDPRWLSYMVATSRSREGRLTEYSVKASCFEKAFVHMLRLASGRFPMYRKQNSRQLAIQLVLNGLTGGDCKGNFPFLRSALRNGTPLLAKRILFQCPAEVDAAGHVIHCAHCPDAVIQEGRLIPVCLTDKWAADP
ncbi:MAG: radical SAM protein [bacterium]